MVRLAAMLMLDDTFARLNSVACLSVSLLSLGGSIR